MSSRFPQSLSVRTKEENLMWSQTFSISLFVERRCNPKNTNQRKSDSNVKALLYCGNQNMQLLFWRRVWAVVGECLQTCQQSQTSVGQRPLYSWFPQVAGGHWLVPVWGAKTLLQYLVNSSFMKTRKRSKSDEPLVNLALVPHFHFYIKNNKIKCD